MLSYLALITGGAFILSWILTPVFRRVACATDTIDYPNGRTIHLTPVPKLGGLAMACSVLCVLTAAALDGELGKAVSSYFVLPAVGALLMIGLGVYDDSKGANCYQKFLVQAVAASLALKAGLEWHWFAPHGVGMWLNSTLTIGWIVGITNATNLIDGLDGLAALVASIASLLIGWLAFASGETTVCLIALCLAGSLIGFLPHNWSPAKIFMGDTGSLLVGYILACLSLAVCQNYSDIRQIAVPALIFGIPILDTILAINRRVVKRVHIFSADKAHLHHRMLKLGLSQNNCVIIMSAVSLVVGCSAVIAAFSDVGATIYPWLLLITPLIAGLALLRYVERQRAKQSQRTPPPAETAISPYHKEETYYPV